MQQANKRQKVTCESHIEDIATFIGEISDVIKSIGENHSTLLKVNREVVAYLKGIKKESENIVNLDGSFNNIIDKET